MVMKKEKDSGATLPSPPVVSADSLPELCRMLFICFLMYYSVKSMYEHHYYPDLYR